MTNLKRNKVRLVKCPKCAKILPEPEQVPLYTCGGCGTILQAKYYRSNNDDVKEQDEVHSNGVTHTSDVGEFSGSSQRSSSAGQQSPDLNEESDQKATENHASKKEARDFHDRPLSSETSFHEGKENGEIDNQTDHFGLSNHNQEQVSAAIRSRDHSSSIERQAAKESKDPEKFNLTNEVEDANRQEKQYDGVLGENDDFQALQKKEQLQNAPNSIATEDEKPELLIGMGRGKPDLENDQYEQSEDVALANHDGLEYLTSPSGSSTVDDTLPIQNNERMALPLDNGSGYNVSDHMVVEIKLEHLQDNRSQEGIDPKLDKVNGHEIGNYVERIAELKLSEVPKSSEITQVSTRSENDFGICESPGVTALPSSKDLGSAKKMCSAEALSPKIENFSDSSNYGSELLRSKISPQNLDPLERVRELLAYDGSVSSFDGNDDQVLQQENLVEKNFRGTRKVASYAGESEESTQWNNVPPGRNTYSSSAFQNQAKSSSMKVNDTIKRSILEEEESLEQNRYPIRNRMNQPRFPFYRSSEVVYETGSSSSYIHDELPSSQMRHQPYRYEEADPCVRKPYHHIESMNSRRASQSSWRENDFHPMSYSYETSGEIYNRSRYPDHVDRRRRAESWSQSSSLSRIPYSGEVYHGRYQNHNPSMHHHHPNHLRWSTQLPPPKVCCRQGLCMAPHREISWGPYDSCPVSPRQYMELDSYPWIQDTVSQSDDQRHKDQIMRRLYVRGKRQIAKRHFQPLAGGAPFVTCYFCFSILHLPEDFLLSRKRRTRRLKCGACLRILEFSLENECSLAPSAPNANESSASDADRNANHPRRSNVGSDALFRHADGKKLLSRDSFGDLNSEKRKSMSRNNVGTERKEISENEAGPSAQGRQTKITWKLPARSKSPLHRLMGYSSPRELLSGHDGKDSQ